MLFAFLQIRTVVVQGFTSDNIPTCSSSSTSAKPSKLRLMKPTCATHTNVLKVALSAPPPAAVKASTKEKGAVAATIVLADSTEGNIIATTCSSHS